MRMVLKLAMQPIKEKMNVTKRILIATFWDFMCLGNAFALINWILSAVNQNKAPVWLNAVTHSFQVTVAVFFFCQNIVE